MQVIRELLLSGDLMRLLESFVHDLPNLFRFSIIDAARVFSATLMYNILLVRQMGCAIGIFIQYQDFNRAVTRLTQNAVRHLGVRHGSEKYIVCEMRDIEGIYTGSLANASCGVYFLASSQPK
jgi:hypothetical protein